MFRHLAVEARRFVPLLWPGFAPAAEVLRREHGNSLPKSKVRAVRAAGMKP